MKFNENLKYLRKQAGLTQEQLAEKLNVSRQAITKWESGQSFPDIENLKEISYIFSVSIDSLVEEIDCKSTTKIKKKIDDIGYFIFSSIFILVTCFFSIYNVIKYITRNEGIIVVSTILMLIMAFIIFVLLIKSYLRNTSETIINMQPTDEGKKERIKYVISSFFKLFIGIIILNAIQELDMIRQGFWKYVQYLISDCIVLFGIFIIIAIIHYIGLEKKVKELNKD